MLLTEKKPRLKCDLAFAKCMYIVFSLLTFFYVNDEKFQKLILPTPQSEIQRKAELIMREEVLQGFEEQRVLVDALTNDLLHTQEQNRSLQHDLDQYKKNTDEQLHYLKVIKLC